MTFEKNISVVRFYYLTKFKCLVAFTSLDIGQYVYCQPGCVVKNFEINRIFLLKSSLLHDQKSRKMFDEIKSIFHHFLRASIEANKNIFLEGESMALK